MELMRICIFLLFFLMIILVDIYLGAEREEDESLEALEQAQKNTKDTGSDTESAGSNPDSLGEGVSRAIRYPEEYSPLGEYAFIIHKLDICLEDNPLSKPLITPEGEQFDARHILTITSKNLSHFHENTRPLFIDMKDLFSYMLPALTSDDKNFLKKQFEKFKTLTWSYNNKDLAKQADDIFCTMKWCGPPPTKEFLEPSLYHAMKEIHKRMKENLQTLSEQIQAARAIHHNLVNTHAFITAFPNFDNNSNLLEKMTNLERELELLMSDLECAKSSERFLIESKRLQHIYKALNIMLDNINENIEAKAKELLDNFKNINTKDKTSVVERLIVHYFLSEKKNVFFNITQGKDYRCSTEYSSFKNVIQSALGGSFIKFKKLYHAMLKKNRMEFRSDYITKPFISIEQSEQQRPDTKQYMNIISAYMRFKSLNLLKKRLLDYERILKETVKFMQYKDPETDPEIIIYAIRQTDIMSLKSETKKMHDSIVSMLGSVENSKKIEMDVNKFRMIHELVRRIQYFSGNACAYCSELIEQELYKEGTTGYDENLKKIVLNFYYLFLTLKKAIKID